MEERVRELEKENQELISLLDWLDGALDAINMQYFTCTGCDKLYLVANEDMQMDGECRFCQDTHLYCDNCVDHFCWYNMCCKLYWDHCGEDCPGGHKSTRTTENS